MADLIVFDLGVMVFQLFAIHKYFIRFYQFMPLVFPNIKYKEFIV